MKSLLRLILFLLPALSLSAAPNIVYILADDMGLGDLSCYNAEAKVDTPHIDKLAALGMRFMDAHTSSAVCTPTRYGLLTGRYNWRSELKARVLNGYSRALVAPGRDTVADLLKRNGYVTAMIGKWHLGMNWMKKDGTRVTELRPDASIEAEIDFTKPFTGGPVDCGFDYFFGINASLDFPPYTYLENDRTVTLPTVNRPMQGGKKVGQPALMMRGGVQAEDFVPDLVLKTLTEKAVDYIGTQSADQPFFLYFPLTAPHTPVLPRSEFKDTSQCGIYGDFIHEIDWTVEQVMQALEENGLLDNTLVIFTADNGASKASFPMEREEAFDHHPSLGFRGRKANIWEGGHRVPFIAKWPGTVDPGTVCETACNLNDFYALCADITGAEIGDDAGEDSFSILPLLMGYPEMYSRNGMVHHDFAGRFAIRDDKWKLVFQKEGAEPLLYDLEADPAETTNTRKINPRTTARLTQLLKDIVLDGRSTPGSVQENDPPQYWEQLFWMKE